jgi:nucleoside phosphorylase/tetratricopeptide (TPR) repeat protein
MSATTDVLIVTATDVESRAVLSAFKEATGREPKPEPIGDRLYLDLGEVNTTRVFMTLSGMGSGGLDGAQEAVRKGIEALSPFAVIMVGIAFGVNEKKQSIGDVLISDRLMLYELQRVGTDQDGGYQIVPRGDRPRASPSLINRFRVASLSWDQSKAEVRLGLVLSGDKLVDNVDFRGQLLDFEPEAIGGDMEGAGLYVACQNSKVDWILVKAICDWGDGHKSLEKAARQQLASANAAAFVLHALQQAPLKSPRPPVLVPEPSLVPALASEPRRPIYSTLPTQAPFFGRETELETIAEAISPEARTWGALIDGPGGIGKTALATQAAHLAPAGHFERKVFLSAQVRELTPAGEQKVDDFVLPNYLALLTELARELGTTDIEQAPPDERPNAVRRALGNVRALLVIDNVETFPEPERVRLYQFLSRLPPGCKAIVTSRRRGNIDARIVRLDRLDRKDALALIADLATRNPHLAKASEQERDDLYETANGSPLLIKWLVGQLGRPGSHCRSIADACVFLGSAPEGNDPLEFIFGDLLGTFTETETAVLAALVHFTGPAQVDWIATVAGIPEMAAVTALEDLTDRALLIADDEAQNFFLPPLAATFIRRKRSEVVTRTGGRLTDRALALTLENGFERFERFATLEHEWPIIAAALPLFALGESTTLQRVCSALRRFLDASGRWDEQVSLNKQAEQKALAAGDLRSAGWYAYQQGWTAYVRGEVPEALAYGARADDHWKTAAGSGANERATSSRLRGLIHAREKNHAAALDALQEALNIFRGIAPESLDVARVRNSLAGVKRDQGEYVAAEHDYREALRIAEAAGSQSEAARIVNNLAALESNRGAWEEAEARAREAIELAERLGQLETIGRSCAILALALARRGSPSEGLPHAQRAVEIVTRLRMNDQLEYARYVVAQCGG